MPCRHRTSRVALFSSTASLVTLAFVACSDGDPKYGPPDAIRGRTINYGVEVPKADTLADGGTGSGATKTPQQLFNDLYLTITGTGAGTKCTPCHEPGGIGVTLFVGTSSSTSYAIFKTNGYQDLAKVNAFYTKGQHTGNPLTPAQQALAKAWSVAEAAGGTPSPVDAGGG